MAQRIAGFHGAMATNCHTGNWTRPALTEDLGCFYDWEGRWGPDCAGLPWQPGKLTVDDPAKITEIVKDTALFLGASLVGIARINPNGSSNRDGIVMATRDRPGAKLPPGIKYAVVMAIETNYDFVRYAPTAKASAAAGLGYSKMAFLAPSMAKFIAMLGYKAIACGNDTALEHSAGGGCRAGTTGPAGRDDHAGIRAARAAVQGAHRPAARATTPIDFGVTEFCDTCEKCAEYCPSQAIQYGRRTARARTVSTNPGLLEVAAQRREVHRVLV